MSRFSTTSLHGAKRFLLLAVLFGALAMLLPSLALADEPAPSDEVVATAPTAPGDTAPVAEQPVVDEPVADPVPVDPPASESPAEPVTEAPAPPPATGDPAPPPEAEATPAPAPAPVLTDPVITPPSSLPGSADAPKGAIEPEKIPLAAMAPDHVTTTGTAATTNVSVDSSVPDAPVTTAPATTTPTVAKAPVVHVSTVNAALPSNLFSIDPSHRTSPVGPATTVEPAAGVPLAGAIADPDLFADTAIGAVGGIESGSSLLSVLAGYVLPGVGGPPAGSIVMFILVGLIVGLAFAPRPQLSERLHLGGLLGARSGHSLAVCRPG